MASSKPQFDAFLGGCHDLPVDLAVRKYVSARAQEIAALTQAIEDPQRTALVFQKLPKHMRRRVMSRTSKRLPRRLREAHMQQLEKSGLPPKPKRPSRKYRRRPKNLLLEYNRRQKKFVWLETHIWHAKRFHMIEKWGYKIADVPNDKCFRACYRATANHCLLQDISYYSCIELSGPEHHLLENLEKLTSKDCGLTFRAKAFLKGTREGSVMLFHQNSYPFGAIGRVSFFWKPVTQLKCEENPYRSLWIWVHPAFYQQVKDELISSFAFIEKTSTLCQDDMESEPISECPSSDNDSESCGSPYENSDGSVEMILLKDVLNRFRLTGPLSQAALSETLHVANVLENKCADNEISRKDWWQEFYGTSEENRSSWKYQNRLWEIIKGSASPSQLPSHLVLSLIVKDPRLELPSKRKKAVPNQSSEELKQISPLSCVSPIWNLGVRDLVTKTKLSSGELAEMRSHSLVPGNMLEELAKSCIPVLLIQRPGCQDSAQNRIGYSSGWDIVLPAGWALPFWLGLVFRGARPGGLRESNSIEFEAIDEHLFPPDTEAGSKEAEFKRVKLTEQHFRLPPDKRPNFLKLGISSPFICAWKILLTDWTHKSLVMPTSKCIKEDRVQFFVLRDKVNLECLRSAVESLKTIKSYCDKGNNSDLTVRNTDSCLVKVTVHMCSKGSPSDLAIICLPSVSDIDNLLKNPNFPGPVEEIHKDENHEERKNLRNDHKKLLKSLRRKRVKRKTENGKL
ncbi:hypothetical protein L9F63_012397 [Diploptera punctata]|uniref:Uncharacterized protein n=1 Tax=Diploptera punctata TaxID=6984 RepID=A0AAD8ENS5_DIPPU|nr:hypothetical protein L9F63_012397 [Diploptera punctata]